MSSPSLRVPRPPTSFVTQQDIKQHNSLPEACYLFIPCLQTNLGAVQRTRKGQWACTRSPGPRYHVPKGWSGPLEPSVCGPRCILATASVLVPNAFWQHTAFIRSHFQTQRKLATDCDGSVHTENGRNQREHFLAALTTYRCEWYHMKMSN